MQSPLRGISQYHKQIPYFLSSKHAVKQNSIRLFEAIVPSAKMPFPFAYPPMLHYYINIIYIIIYIILKDI